MHISLFATSLLSGFFFGCRAYPRSSDQHEYIPESETDSMLFKVDLKKKTQENKLK
jgi:hypothetical protein